MAGLPAGRSSAIRRPARSTRSTARTTSSAPSSAFAALCPPGRWWASRAARSTSCRWTSSPRRWTSWHTSPASTGGLSTSPTLSRRPSGGLVKILTRPRMRRARQSASTPGTRRAADPAGVKARRPEPVARRISDLALAELGVPREVVRLRRPTRRTSTHPRRRRRSPARGSRCRRSRPTRRRSGSTGSATSARTAARTARWRGRKGKTVMITGASSGIGKAAAFGSARPADRVSWSPVAPTSWSRRARRSRTAAAWRSCTAATCRT